MAHNQEIAGAIPAYAIMTQLVEHLEEFRSKAGCNHTFWKAYSILFKIKNELNPKDYEHLKNKLRDAAIENSRFQTNWRKRNPEIYQRKCFKGRPEDFDSEIKTIIEKYKS